MKTKIGNLCADLGSTTPGGRRRYLTIGAAFLEDKTQRISVKIDCLPLASDNWQGWANVFPMAEKNPSRQDDDSDIPF